jgi:hypothetical protein
MAQGRGRRFPGDGVRGHPSGQGIGLAEKPSLSGVSRLVLGDRNGPTEDKTAEERARVRTWDICLSADPNGSLCRTP